MDRFEGLTIICWITTIIGWISTLGGLLAIIAFLPTPRSLLFFIGTLAAASGVWVVLASGTIHVLIGIYQNTCKGD